MKRLTILGLVVVVALTMVVAGCKKDEEKPPAKPSSGANATVQVPVEERVTTIAPDLDTVAPGTEAAIAKGIKYLAASQLPDGGWWGNPQTRESDLGITTVVAHGLVTAGVTAADPTLNEAVAYILRYVKDDGGIYDSGLKNYTTSIGVMVLKKVDETKHRETIKNALAFLKELQWDEGEGLQPESADFGGTGYGANKRPDLSNTVWFVQAMKELGVDKDDDAMKNARIFVSRTQAAEAAKGYWVSNGKGGFIYTPHGGGESKAGEFTLPSGGKGLKAYGSMTYAGFLSLIYSGLDRTDPRVKAAHDWVQLHWTVEENPQIGMEGHLYYLMTMGKALRAYGSTKIVDEQGVAHDWRKELSVKLISIQKEDGSWINDGSPRWYEANRFLATSYALIAMDACKAKL